MKTKNISLKSFISSLIVLFVLMVVTYILTLIIPAGEYTRIINSDNQSIIDVTVPFKYVDGGITFINWLLSPFLVLTAEGSLTIIVLLVFLLVIGGILNCLTDRNLINYLISKVSYKYAHRKYLLVAIIQLILMLMGSFIGSFEEITPLVPILIALFVALGFNKYTGLGVSLLSCSAGFSCGIMNAFTVGVAQKLAGIPMFSGVWLRIVSFVLIYLLLIGFLHIYSKNNERNVEYNQTEFTNNNKLDKAILSFVIILGIGILCIIISPFISFLSDYILVVILLVFLISGTVSSFISGMTAREYFKSFGKGALLFLPAALMILMASSIRYTLEEAKVLDTILHYFIGIADGIPKFAVVLLIYLIVLIMNFFIASGSAKAFLLIPLIIPIAQIFGISPQLCILAYCFGDGFSNVVYPTNPVLLISLSLSDTPYPKWLKFIWKYELINLILTSLILMFGLIIGY